MEKTKLKTVKTETPITSIDDLAEAYIDLRDEEKALAERKKEIQEQVKFIMGRRTSLPTAHGEFRVEERRTYTWTVDAIRGFFGPKAYQAFLKADDKLVKAKMETVPELEKLADVKIVEALTLR